MTAVGGSINDPVKAYSSSLPLPTVDLPIHKTSEVKKRETLVTELKTELQRFSRINLRVITKNLTEAYFHLREELSEKGWVGDEFIEHCAVDLETMEAGTGGSAVVW